MDKEQKELNLTNHKEYMSKKLKSFTIGIISPTVIMDENNQYRLGRVVVDENNDLRVRYYLPQNNRERSFIKKSLVYDVPQLTVYE
jgi:hypothetical protein